MRLFEYYKGIQAEEQQKKPKTIFVLNLFCLEIIDDKTLRFSLIS
jgi:hypothetical protein